MPLFALDSSIVFPPVHLSEPDGLLAIGGDLSIQRLLNAYRNGIFPWYEGEHILWWCPDPRFVLFPENLHISKSMRTLLNQRRFEFTLNQAFPQVISQCKTVPRKGQQGTWINDDVSIIYPSVDPVAKCLVALAIARCILDTAIILPEVRLMGCGAGLQLNNFV